MEFQFRNKSKVSTRSKTPEGYLDLSATIYRSGLFEFSPREFPTEDLPEDLRSKKTIVLNVPDDAVSEPAFLDSVAARPVTDGHPSEFVNAKTARYIQRGTSKGPARVENAGDVRHVNADLRLVDEEIISSVESDERQEVSIGNTGLISWEPGTRSGREFDGVLDTIRVNHIAIVNRGRGGRDVRLLNDQTGDKMETVTKIINGIEIQVAKDNEKLVDSLVTKIENHETELATVRAELENEKTARAKAEKERDEAKVSDEDITRLVNERTETVATAKRLSKDLDPAGKSTREIKVAAIKAVNEKLVSDDATDEVVNAVFETLAKTDRTESSDAGKRVQEAINNGSPADLENEDPTVKARRERSERRKSNFAKRNFGK